MSEFKEKSTKDVWLGDSKVRLFRRPQVFQCSYMFHLVYNSTTCTPVLLFWSSLCPLWPAPTWSRLLLTPVARRLFSLPTRTLSVTPQWFTVRKERRRQARLLRLPLDVSSDRPSVLKLGDIFNLWWSRDNYVWSSLLLFLTNCAFSLLHCTINHNHLAACFTVKIKFHLQVEKKCRPLPSGHLSIHRT